MQRGAALMGARGPAKTPTNLAVVRGQRKDRINTQAPVPPVGDPKPPEWLSAEAVAVWSAQAPSLIRQGLLTSRDVDEFAAFCDAVARRAEAAGHLDDEGVVLEVPVVARGSGEVVGSRTQKSHWWGVWKDANDIAGRKGAQFGMTPSARTGLKVDDDHHGSQEDFFAG